MNKSDEKKFESLDTESKKLFEQEILRFHEDISSKSADSSFVIVMHYGDLIWKQLGEYEKISVRKGTIFATNGLENSNGIEIGGLNRVRNPN
jgi:hypothetical protein